MNVQLEAVLLGKLITNVESPLNLVAATAAGHLHKHREREICRAHSLLLHLLEQPHAAVVKTLTRTAVEEGVVHDLIWFELSGPAHIVKHFERLLEPIRLAVAFDDGTVGDNADLEALPIDLLQEHWDASHVAAPGASVNQCVERHQRELHLALDHLVIDSPNAVETPLVSETLQDRPVDNGIHQVTSLLIFRHFLDHVVGSLALSVHG
mmetsp:Transcript_100973/g.179151  ORF Transcript_100973/g.179151 Transcript_100973/m.179151 type:complete len:209 (+) Transcript_100973:193-819(+)